MRPQIIVTRSQRHTQQAVSRSLCSALHSLFLIFTARGFSRFSHWPIISPLNETRGTMPVRVHVRCRYAASGSSTVNWLFGPEAVALLGPGSTASHSHALLHPLASERNQEWILLPIRRRDSDNPIKPFFNKINRVLGFSSSLTAMELMMAFNKQSSISFFSVPFPAPLIALTEDQETIH